jgi:hypothetical protein
VAKFCRCALRPRNSRYSPQLQRSEADVIRIGAICRTKRKTAPNHSLGAAFRKFVASLNQIA